MKKLLFACIFSYLAFSASAQKTEYITKIDVPYYSDSVNQTDKYKKEQCVLDIYYPKNAKGFATIIWFHGGGLTGGSNEIPKALIDKNLCIVSAEYRLYPKVKCPEYIVDAAAAVAWVFKNIESYGGDASLIFISGHSAGGYLTSMIGLDKKWLQAYNIDANKIAGLIPFSGQTITHFTIRNERGISQTQPVVDEYAPLFHVRADAPPLVLITGDREMELLGRYEENAYLMRMMKVVGHKSTILYELEGYGHNMEEPAFPLLLKYVNGVIEAKKSGQK